MELNSADSFFDATSNNRRVRDVEDASTLVSFEDFFRDVMPRLVGMLTLRVGDRSEAEDLANEAMAKALAGWDRVGAMETPAGWVYRVALNSAASRWRRMKRRMRIESAADRSEPVLHLLTAESLAIREAMAQLSERQRQVIVLRYYVGCDVQETADILQVSGSTVTTQSARALARLRSELGDDDGR